MSHISSHDFLPFILLSLLFLFVIIYGAVRLFSYGSFAKNKTKNEKLNSLIYHLILIAFMLGILMVILHVLR